jgi:hypothetical protein
MYRVISIIPSGISDLCGTAIRMVTAKGSISISKESLKLFLCSRRHGELAGFNARGAVVTKHGVNRE